MNRKLAVVVTCTSVGLLVPGALPAGAEPRAPSGEGDTPTFCTIAGSVAPTPGIGYVPSAGTYELAGTMDCTSESPRHGEMKGTGTGTLGCSGGTSTALLNVAWDNGKTSTMKVQFRDFADGTGGYGTVDEGEFAGSQVGLGWGGEAAGAEARCVAGQVKSYEFAGGVMIG